MHPWHLSRYTPEETDALFEWVEKLNAQNGGG